MEIKWKDTLIKSAEEIILKGGRLEFIVYKRDRKRKLLIHFYPDCEINCEEIEIIDG